MTLEKYDSPRAAELLSMIETNNRRIQGAEDTINNLDPLVKRLVKKDRLVLRNMQRRYKENYSLIQEIKNLRSLNTHFYINERRNRARYANVAANLKREQNHLTHHTDELARINKPENEKERWIYVDLAEQQDLIASITNVKNIVIDQDLTAIHTNITYSGLVMRCNGDYIDDIELDDISVYIKIDKTNRHLDLSASGTRVTAFEDRALVHPHWISDDEPCLGDFQQSLTEAAEYLCIQDMVVILQMFLEQADTDDSAGRYAENWA